MPLVLALALVGALSASGLAARDLSFPDSLADEDDLFEDMDAPAEIFARDAHGHCARLVLVPSDFLTGSIEHLREPTEHCDSNMIWPKETVDMGSFRCAEISDEAVRGYFARGDRTDGCSLERTTTVTIKEAKLPATVPKLTWLSATSPTCHTELALELPSLPAGELPTGEFYFHNSTNGICTRLTLRNERLVSAVLERMRFPNDPDEPCVRPETTLSIELLGSATRLPWHADGSVIGLTGGNKGELCADGNSADLHVVGVEDNLEADARMPELVFKTPPAACRAELELRVPMGMLQRSALLLPQPVDVQQCGEMDPVYFWLDTYADEEVYYDNAEDEDEEDETDGLGDWGDKQRVIRHALVDDDSW
jgi:hypothetical protein